MKSPIKIWLEWYETLRSGFSLSSQLPVQDSSSINAEVDNPERLWDLSDLDATLANTVSTPSSSEIQTNITDTPESPLDLEEDIEVEMREMRRQMREQLMNIKDPELRAELVSSAGDTSRMREAMAKVQERVAMDEKRGGIGMLSAKATEAGGAERRAIATDLAKTLSQAFDLENVNKYKNNVTNFKFNALKFSHKIYTIFHASTTIQTHFLIWLDADCYTFRKIPFILFPKLVHPNYYLTFLDRLYANIF